VFITKVTGRPIVTQRCRLLIMKQTVLLLSHRRKRVTLHLRLKRTDTRNRIRCTLALKC